MNIKKIYAREILDSRGFPTIEAFMQVGDNVFKSSVPSGASVGKFEALELRDCDKNRFFGKGVLKAVNNINKKIAPFLIGQEPDLLKFDKLMFELDKTSNKSTLGANAILAVSILAARAQAFSQNKILYNFLKDYLKLKNISIPKVMFNVLNGGAHADNGINFQEFMIMSVKNQDFSNILSDIVKIYQNLKKLLHKSGYSVGIGDEGGFAPKFLDSKISKEKQALDFLSQAVELSGLKLGQDIVFCLDVAASQFYSEQENKYLFYGEKLSSQDIINIYKDLIKSYPIISIEDGLAETDWAGWSLLTEQLKDKVQLVGDDIFVTNINLIQKGIKEKVANACLIKPNQIGSVTETLDTINFCKKSGYKTVVSHRSGETCDDFIADLVVGTNSGQFKAGAPCRSERVAKYNRLLEIESEIK